MTTAMLKTCNQFWRELQADGYLHKRRLSVTFTIHKWETADGGKDVIELIGGRIWTSEIPSPPIEMFHAGKNILSERTKLLHDEGKEVKLEFDLQRQKMHVFADGVHKTTHSFTS